MLSKVALPESLLRFREGQKYLSGSESREEQFTDIQLHMRGVGTR